LGRRAHPACAIALAATVMGILAAGFVPLAAADTNLGTNRGFTYIQDRADSLPAGTGATLTADCPAGTRLIGGGMRNPLNYQFNLVNAFYPADGPDADAQPNDRFVSRVYSRTDTGNSHFVYAICAAGASPTYHQEVYDLAPDEILGATSFCPPDMHVSSGGVRIPGPYAAAEVNSSFPVDGPDADHITDDGWRVRVVSKGSTSEMRVFAICRAVTPTYRGPYTSGFPPGTGFGYVTSCYLGPADPAGPVMGGGVELFGSPTRQHLSSSEPITDNPSNLGFAWGIEATSEPTAPSGTFSLYAICKP
jgi:hypothetical protein